MGLQQWAWPRYLMAQYGTVWIGIMLWYVVIFCDVLCVDFSPGYRRMFFLPFLLTSNWASPPSAFWVGICGDVSRLWMTWRPQVTMSYDAVGPHCRMYDAVGRKFNELLGCQRAKAKGRRTLTVPNWQPVGSEWGSFGLPSMKTDDDSRQQKVFTWRAGKELTLAL